ncbi:MAG: hypothetical protein ACP5R4_07875, partial [Armatimonadota bacterium]
ALNPMIKVMNLVGILIAPVAISPIPGWVRAVVVLGCVAILAAAVTFSKRGSIAEEIVAEPSKVGAGSSDS